MSTMTLQTAALHPRARRPHTTRDFLERLVWLQEAQARRNQASREIGKAKAVKDDASLSDFDVPGEAHCPSRGVLGLQPPLAA